MSFSKSNLEEIKSKTSLSSEIEKKSKIIKKGKDYWCCCLFHNEKTPSMKINDEQGSYYCFGCGAKGDIITLYTDYFNYSFQDAVNELAQKSNVILDKTNYQRIEKTNVINSILETTTEWFQKNLELPESNNYKAYLKKRKLSDKTILKFRLGTSYNSKMTLLDYLKSKKFSEKDIIKSNVVKFDKNNNLKDFFYKRIIFPIMDDKSKVIGFGGRALGDINPKYINSPESDYFKKRNILYNLCNAKISSRKKNNVLICEGYFDVVSLYEKGIESVVAPLGTALTDNQLNLAWKYCSKPSLMFDGDNAGIRAAYKTALLSLEYISPKKLIQFINLPKDEDPDSYINKNSLENFINILKNPVSLVDFIFYQASQAYSFEKVDDKIVFDKYIDEIIQMIKDNKIRFFYKNEFKSLFFEKLKFKNKKIRTQETNYNFMKNSLFQQQLYSFIAAYLNHKNLRSEIADELIKSDLLKGDLLDLFQFINKPETINKTVSELFEIIKNENFVNILNKSLKSDIYQLFPYSSPKYAEAEALLEIKESCKNLKTRLLYLKKINKSLDSFHEKSDQLNWEELQKINKELLEDRI